MIFKVREMKVEYDNLDKQLVLKITEELDHHSCDKIRGRADFEIQSKMPKSVVFDFQTRPLWIVLV